MSNYMSPGGGKPGSPLRGQQVSMGDSVELDNDEFRRHVESSLEKLAKQRLLEAETRANTVLETAEQEASRMLSEARDEVMNMLRKAQEETGDIRKNAHDEGYAEGYEEGFNDGTRQIVTETVDLIKGVDTLVDGAIQAEKLVLKNFEENALALVRTIAQRVVSAELAQSPELILGMLDRAIENLQITGRVKVVLSTQALQNIQEFSRDGQAAIAGLKRLDLIGDPALALEQVFVIAEEGSFDISPSAQIAQLTAPLEKSLGFPRPELDPMAGNLDFLESAPVEALPGAIGDTGTLPQPDLSGSETSLDAALETEALRLQSLEVIEPLPDLIEEAPADDEND